MDGLLNMAGSQDNPIKMKNGSEAFGNLEGFMNLNKENSTDGMIDMEKKKEGIKLLGDFMSLVKNSHANDTEGTKSAMANLTSDLAKFTPKSTGEEKPNMENLQDLLTSFSGNNETETGSNNGTFGSLFKDRTHFSGHHRNHFSNMTEYLNNSTNYNNTDNNSTGNSLFPNLRDLSTGLSGRDLADMNDIPPVNLNETYSESGFLSVTSSLIMITFFYYVPRMLYYRASNYTKDSQHSSFVPLLYLSLIACAGAGIHVANAYYHATHNVVASVLSGNFELSNDNFSIFIYKSLVASINRIVSPIVLLLCLQQVSTHSQYNILYIFQHSLTQIIYCLISTIAVFGYSFAREYFFMESLSEYSLTYPDKIHVDLIDLICPITTTFFFFVARNAIARQSLYTTEKYGPNGPTTLDRVSKVVVFQAVMAFFAICAIFWSPSEEEEKSLSETASTWQYFFITAQTPVVHFILFRSLLRSRKSTRICFLVCCHSGEKVSTADNGVELNQHPRTNEPSEKTEEGEEEEEENKEENTMETLDHNKIIIMPEGKIEEKQEENKL